MVERTAAGIPHLRAVDGFRALALAGVVAIHLLLASGAVDAVSHAGQLVIWGLFGNIIDGFFIISGFGLFLPVVAAGGRIGNLRSWATRRWARLFPAYWLCIATLLVVLALAPYPGRGLDFPDTGEIVIHLTAMQMPAKLFESDFPIGFNADGPLWMVSVIFGFYLVFPLIARQYHRHPVAGLAVAAAITLAWREAAIHATSFFDSINGAAPDLVTELIVTDQLPGWAFSFALGMTGAWAYHGLQQRGTADSVRRPASLLAAGGLIACCICGYFYGQEALEVDSAIAGSHARAEPVLGLAYSASRAVLMAGIALGPLWMQAPFVNRPVRRGAELSYAFYLIHLAVAVYVCRIWLDLPTDGAPLTVLAWFAVVVSISLLYALASRRLVERPVRKWAIRVTTPSPPPVPGLAAARSPSPP